ncbi:MAG TPA: ATP synthase F1 subunit epsilon [Ignavibacteria bacterium]
MDDKSFLVDIVSPSKQVFSGKVVSLTAPGTEGNFQILYNHADFLTSLTYGEIKLVIDDNNVIHYATSGGFLEVKDNKVIILAETIEKSDEIDIERSKEKLLESQKLLSEKNKALDQNALMDSIRKAQNRIKIAEKYLS